MASYLCVKMNSSATKSYNIKSSANKPYLRVDTGFIPLTTATATGPKVMVRAGGVNYRLADFITTTTAITTNTSYLTSAKTTGTSYETGSRSSTSGTGYESRVSTSVTTYYTRASTSATTYYTRASTSATTYYTRKSTSVTTYYTRASTSATGYRYRTDTSILWSETFTFASNTTSSTGTNSGIIAAAVQMAGNHTYDAVNRSARFYLRTSNSKVTTSFIYPINSAQSSTALLKTTKNDYTTMSLARSSDAGGMCIALIGGGNKIIAPLSNISRNNYTHTIKFVVPLSLSSKNSIISFTQKQGTNTVTMVTESRYDNNNSFIVNYILTATNTVGARLSTEALSKHQFITPNNTYTSLVYVKQATAITATTYATRASTSTTSYFTRQSTSTTSYLTRASTSTTSYLTRASTSATSYLTRSSTSNTTYATRSSQYTSNTVYLTQSETYQTSYLTTSAETTIEG